MAKYNIAVTGLNAADNPSPGIGVIRCLKEENPGDFKIIGLAYELLCSVSYMEDLVDEVYHVPFPQEDEAGFLRRLTEITEKTKIDVIIPNLDFEVPIFSRLELELRDLGIRLLVPQSTSLDLSKKENIYTLAHLARINVPYSIILSDRRQITATAANFSYPFVVKAARGEAMIVYSLQEAIVYSNRLAKDWGWPLIMQVLIKGDEFCVAMLADRRHRIIGNVCMKKILKSRNGTAWMGVTIQDQELLDLSEKIIQKLEWVGPIELEFIKEQVYNKFYLIEINPRFPTWIQLAAKAGSNLVLSDVKIALRQEVKPNLSYKSGILFSRSSMDNTCDISRLGQLSTKKELIYGTSK